MEPQRPTSETPELPELGLRFRMLYALWHNSEDWRTRGSAARAMVILGWRHATRRRRG